MNRSETRFRSCSPLRHRAFTIQGEDSGHDYDYPNQSPRGGNQFFGHVAIATDGAMTVSLRDLHGTTLWDRTLDPRQSSRRVVPVR